ncbi:MAG: hypothetical protein CVV32_08930 [Methanomicrobiales archaeon HGW-Methanomicrobiales-3]|jgi:HEAT repeat protein|nr:MAG: hypothetical protein CVV32_08930 [Methanomicrobiales archaeon HGW-Methanomicrobiales-3]
MNVSPGAIILKFSSSSSFFSQNQRDGRGITGKVNGSVSRMGGCRIRMGDAELSDPKGVPSRESEPEDPGILEERRKEQVKGYIALLKDPNLTFRWKAAEALGTAGDSTAIEPLLEALNDPFVDVQWLAAKSLGRIGDSRCVEPLINAMKSPDKWLRVGAAWGLGKLKDPRATLPLIELLTDKKKTVRKNAAWALGNIADERAVPGLTKSLQDPDEDVRNTAQKSLAAIERAQERRTGSPEIPPAQMTKTRRKP